MMARTTLNFAAALLAIGALSSGSVMAQQPADATPSAGASATHSDPIVQKRMEVRQANQKQRAANAKTNQQAREQRAKAQAQRNQSVQESRSRASAAMSASNPQ
jgi:hypothetical protein